MDKPKEEDNPLMRAALKVVRDHWHLTLTRQALQNAGIVGPEVLELYDGSLVIRDLHKLKGVREDAFNKLMSNYVKSPEQETPRKRENMATCKWCGWAQDERGDCTRVGCKGEH